MFLQPERKGKWGGARLQEHSLSAPPDRFGLIAGFRLAVFRAVQENRPVETPCLASDVISLDFIKLWGEMPNALAMRMSSMLSRQTCLALAHCGSYLGLFVFAMGSWIELVADDVVNA